MSKFVMECPSCGNYVEADAGLFGTGLFARKTVKCACGSVIDVKANKLATRTCNHCGNQVVFDQSKADKAVCPVCHEPINELADQSKVDEFNCEQCGIVLTASKSADFCTCPICDFENDVQKRMAQYRIKKSGAASIIKYEGDNNTFIWKHPIEDFNMGSQLIVHESQEAVFFRDGQALDLFGAGRYTLETQKLPLIGKAYQLPVDPDSTFHSEVYFINLATQMGIKWGTDSKVGLFDPASGMHLEIGACGEFNIRVTNSRKLLLKLVGTTSGMTQDDLLGKGGSKGFFRAAVMTRVKSFLIQTIKDNNYNILEIDYRLDELSAALKERINKDLESYGLEMPEFYVTKVLTPDDDPNFKRMKQQYADQYLRVREEEIRRKEAEAAAERKIVEAQTEARLKMIGAQGDAESERIKGQAAADTYRMQAEAEALEMKMKGYTYQQETARQVGLEAMKNGITGNGSGAAGGLGDIAGLGVTLGAMGGVMTMTKEAISPMLDTTKEIGQTAVSGAADKWDCKCGNKGITGRFCNTCGAMRPEPKPDNTWDCECGNKRIIGMFCNMCGAKRPEPKKADTWDCECGNKGIIGMFCNMCGAKRPEQRTQDTWDCTCGNKGITGKFCAECGAKRPEPKKADTWDCACGNKGITGKFCAECGAKRPEPKKADTWDCACGNKGITGKFCAECGAKRPEEAPPKPDTWDCKCGNKGITGKFCAECGKRKDEQ